MKQLFFALVFVALPGNGPEAQQDAQQRKADLPKGQMPDLGRPTDKDDALPLFDYETYFTGKWKFEWIVPDSPFGPGGIIQGTEIFHPGEDGKFFESDVEGTGPSGAFPASSMTIYDAEYKFMARHETDSRGFFLMKAGHIGGDLGGYYTIYYESAPFEYEGQTIRLKTTTILYSPLHFKVKAQISVDGGKYVNFGNPWWRKEVPGVTDEGK